MSDSEHAHFAYIDAVRGLAFLAVLSVHVALSVGQFFGRNVLAQGGYGVQLFFLASAITLCHSMAARQQRDKFPTGYFYLRRLFRIAPLFWLAMAFYWTFPGVMPRFWVSQWAPVGVRPWYFALTAIFFHGWHPFTFNSIVPGGWSIAVEMTFYVFFPMLFLLLGLSLRRTVIGVLCGMFCLKPMIYVGLWFCQHLYTGIPDNVSGFFAGGWFPSQLPIFLIGFLAYHVTCNGTVKRIVQKRFWANSLLCFCAMGLLSFLRANSSFIPTSIWIVLSFCGCVVAMSGGSIPWLINPALRYLGKISYSCYLVHFAALGLTLRLFGIHLTAGSTFFETGHSLSNLLLFCSIFASTLLLTVMISTVTLHLIETPGIGLGRRLIEWITASFGKSVDESILHRVATKSYIEKAANE